MLTLAQTYSRIRWYMWLSRFIRATLAGLMAVCILKTLYPLTQNYLNWLYPFSWFGWVIQWIAVWIQVIPGGSFVWRLVAVIDPPSWWFLRTGVLLWIFFLYIARRIGCAGDILNVGLQKAIHAAQLAAWQAELSGQPFQPVTNNDIGVQVNIYQQLPAPPSSFWTKPLGLLFIAIVGGVITTIVGQWLNLQLGLAH